MNNPFSQENHITEMHSLGLPKAYITKLWEYGGHTEQEVEEKLCECVYISFVHHRSE